MKYESSILNRLIEVYGVVGNPRYISEIIKQFIVQGKECYPNLFTYQADWLAHIDEFGLTPEYTVSYTGQHIYAPNTKEKPVKRAILKGQTMINLVSQYENSSGILRAAISGTFEPNKKYIIRIYNNPFNVISRRVAIHGADYIYSGFEENEIFINTTDRAYNLIYIEFKKSDETFPTVDEIAQIKVLVLEYQEGMENWDIPYFEGMQSVKMPVLTTSNEDGTKTNILTVNEDVTLRSNGSVCDELDLLTGKLTQRIDEDGEILTQEVVKTVGLTIHDKDHQKVERLTSFDGGTHFTTSSQDGSLLPTLTVDVVTDLEKTLMVCSLEGNTI